MLGVVNKISELFSVPFPIAVGAAIGIPLFKSVSLPLVPGFRVEGTVLGIDAKVGVFIGLISRPPSAALTVVAVTRDWAWAIEGAKIASNPSQQTDLSILTGHCFYS
jgi:hypothetical protein